MRTIKFRGWNGEKMFLYNYWFILEHQSTLCFDMYEEHSYVDDSDVDYPKRIELMQYTGLHDKNGKAIYEGDICKIELEPSERFNLKYGYAICIVEWDEERTGFNFIAKINKTTNNSRGWSMSNANNFEVIGNIYENPELLDDKVTV